MRRTKEELLAAISAVIGERTDDEALSLIEDVTDTVTELSGGEDWKSKYEALDAEWRAKYRARFFEPKAETQETVIVSDEGEEAPKPMNYSDLFTEEG